MNILLSDHTLVPLPLNLFLYLIEGTTPESLHLLLVYQPILTLLPSRSIARKEEMPGKPLMRLLLWLNAHVINSLPLITRLLIKLVKSSRPGIISNVMMVM